MGHLGNTINDRSEKTLPTKILTILNFPSHLDRNQKSWCLRDYNQDSISPYHLQLNQYQPNDKLVCFYFNEIELEHECEPNLQFCDSVQNFESMLTPVILPNLDPFPEPTLILVPIDFEIEPPILKIHNLLMGKECES